MVHLASFRFECLQICLRRADPAVAHVALGERVIAQFQALSVCAFPSPYVSCLLRRSEPFQKEAIMPIPPDAAELANQANSVFVDEDYDNALDLYSQVRHS